MIIKVLITIGLMIIAMPAIGTVLGWGIGLKAEKYVYPSVLLLWGLLIYFIWFHGISLEGTTLLIILGWIIVVWLFISTIYSSYYHFSNYAKLNNSEIIVAKDLDFRGQEEPIDRSNFIKRVLWKQISKIMVIVVLVYYLVK
jgi:hypothetical protein